MRHLYLVFYDVREDRRLQKAAKILKGYGERVQYSVFRCHLSERNLERLRWELTKVMEPEDSLLIVELCQACAGKVRARNAEGEWPEEAPGWVIV
jgi:CRISPR-associated protein Cas2